MFICHLGYAQESPPDTCPPGSDSSGSAYLFIALDPCRGETYEGRCDGMTLIWCEDLKVKTANCKRACGWDRANSFYNCL